MIASAQPVERSWISTHGLDGHGRRSCASSGRRRLSRRARGADLSSAGVPTPGALVSWRGEEQAPEVANVTAHGEPSEVAAPVTDVRWSIEGRIATITLDRPPVNAIRIETWESLRDALDGVRAAAGCNVVVLRSSSPTIFCAGADLKEPTLSPARAAERQRLAWQVLNGILRFPVPVICSVPGPALGAGCAIASVCDIRMASEQATFGLPEIDVARAGGARHLMRVLPQDAVRHAFFTGRPLPAREAWRLGMVREVLADVTALDAAVADVADAIARKSPTAIRMAKQALDLVEELPLGAGYEVEQQFTLRLHGMPDAAEAAAAFRERRPPRWSDA
jgi:enoyl-CoA hydratase